MSAVFHFSNHLFESDVKPRFALVTFRVYPTCLERNSGDDEWVSFPSCIRISTAQKHGIIIQFLKNRKLIDTPVPTKCQAGSSRRLKRCFDPAIMTRKKEASSFKM